MTGPELCPKCKGLHFKTASCIQRKIAAIAHVRPSKANLASAVTAALQSQMAYDDKPAKRHVGRPKTITDMKAYKAAKAREYRAKAKNANS